MLKIYIANTDEDLEQVRVLFQEYTDYLKDVLSEYLTLPWFVDYLRGFEKELTNLPGEYGPPTGCLQVVSLSPNIRKNLLVALLLENCVMKLVK